MIKLSLVIVTSVLTASCLSTKTTAKAQLDQLPNIVYILADDMGIGDIRALNENAKVSTPNLDQLVAGGINFTDAHTAAAVCTPTRYGIITGRYPWRTELKKGVLDGTSRRMIEPNVDTAPALLRRNGYRTAMIGKWHLGWNWQAKKGETLDINPQNNYKLPAEGKAAINFEKPFTGGPVDCGFDYFYGINASLDMGPYMYIENDKALAVPVNKFARRGKKDEGLEAKQSFMRGGEITPGFKPETVLLSLTNKSVDYIDNHSGDQPFFLYLPLTAPHTPVIPRPEFVGTSKAGQYGDFIQELDWTVGEVMAALRRNGLEENTLVIFTADNGASKVSFPLEFEEKYDHQPSREFKGRKGSLNEGGHRVPFIAQWKGTIKPGSSSDAPVCLNDLYATCAAILGANHPTDQGVDSYNMLPLLLGKTHYDRVVTVYNDFGGRLSIRKGDWKLITNKNKKKRELYRIGQDPSERENLYGNLKFQDKEEELMADLNKVILSGESREIEPTNTDSVKVWPQLYWLEQ